MPKHVLTDQAEMQRLCLFFESIAVAPTPIDHVPRPHHRIGAATRDVLREAGILQYIRMDHSDAVEEFIRPHLPSGSTIVQRGAHATDIPIPALSLVAAYEKTTKKGSKHDRAVRAIANHLHFKGAPSAAFVGQPDLDASGPTLDVLSVALYQVMLPPVAITWKELLEFRALPESRAQFARLRSWLSGRAALPSTGHDLVDEITMLMSDHDRFISQNFRTRRLAALHGLIAVGTDLALSLAGEPSIGASLGAMFSIQHQRIAAASEGEGGVPGSEIAYIAAASKFNTKKRR